MCESFSEWLPSGPPPHIDASSKLAEGQLREATERTENVRKFYVKKKNGKKESQPHGIPLHSYLFVSRPKLARRRLLEAPEALPCRVSGGIWQLLRRCPTEKGRNNPRIRPDETVVQIGWPPVLVNNSREAFSIGYSAALRSAERDQQ